MKPILALAIALLTTLSAAAANQNILLIITDNQNWFDVGCYGNKVVQTPHMDQLAAEGVRFRQAFATVASCSASRAVIYSGVLTHRNGQYAHTPGEHNQRLRPDITTVFEKLKQHGYRTALIGKQHIGPPEKYPLDFTTALNPKGVTTHAAATKDVTGLGKACDELITSSKEQPFFLTLALGDPHPNSLDGVAWGVEGEAKYDPAAIESRCAELERHPRARDPAGRGSGRSRGWFALVHPACGPERNASLAYWRSHSGEPQRARHLSISARQCRDAHAGFGTSRTLIALA